MSSKSFILWNSGITKNENLDYEVTSGGGIMVWHNEFREVVCWMPNEIVRKMNWFEKLNYKFSLNFNGDIIGYTE